MRMMNKIVWLAWMMASCLIFQGHAAFGGGGGLAMSSSNRQGMTNQQQQQQQQQRYAQQQQYTLPQPQQRPSALQSVQYMTQIPTGCPRWGWLDPQNSFWGRLIVSSSTLTLDVLLGIFFLASLYISLSALYGLYVSLAGGGDGAWIRLHRLDLPPTWTTFLRSHVDILYNWNVRRAIHHVLSTQYGKALRRTTHSSSSWWPSWWSSRHKSSALHHHPHHHPHHHRYHGAPKQQRYLDEWIVRGARPIQPLPQSILGAGLGSSRLHHQRIGSHKRFTRHGMKGSRHRAYSAQRGMRRGAKHYKHLKRPYGLRHANSLKKWTKRGYKAHKKIAKRGFKALRKLPKRGYKALKKLPKRAWKGLTRWPRRLKKRAMKRVKRGLVKAGHKVARKVANHVAGAMLHHAKKRAMKSLTGSYKQKHNYKSKSKSKHNYKSKSKKKHNYKSKSKSKSKSRESFKHKGKGNLAPTELEIVRPVPMIPSIL